MSCVAVCFAVEAFGILNGAPARLHLDAIFDDLDRKCILKGEGNVYSQGGRRLVVYHTSEISWTNLDTPTVPSRGKLTPLSHPYFIAAMTFRCKYIYSCEMSATIHNLGDFFFCCVDIRYYSYTIIYTGFSQTQCIGAECSRLPYSQYKYTWIYHVVFFLLPIPNTCCDLPDIKYQY